MSEIQLNMHEAKLRRSELAERAWQVERVGALPAVHPDVFDRKVVAQAQGLEIISNDANSR